MGWEYLWVGMKVFVGGGGVGGVCEWGCLWERQWGCTFVGMWVHVCMHPPNIRNRHGERRMRKMRRRRRRRRMRRR